MNVLLADPVIDEIYTLSLHDALPISPCTSDLPQRPRAGTHDHHGRNFGSPVVMGPRSSRGDRKSTRLNSSHVEISYAVFCLKKKRRRAHQASIICTRSNKR